MFHILESSHLAFCAFIFSQPTACNTLVKCLQADRNRTTSAKGLLEIPVPVPKYQSQLWFDELFDKIQTVRQLRAETVAQRVELLPAVLDQVFNGKVTET